MILRRWHIEVAPWQCGYPGGVLVMADLVCCLWSGGLLLRVNRWNSGAGILLGFEAGSVGLGFVVEVHDHWQLIDGTTAGDWGSAVLQVLIGIA
jgi:hypothetical protein